MLLVMDVGNTNTVIGLYDDDQLKDHWRLSTNKQKTVDEYGLLLDQLFKAHSVVPEDISDVIMSTVVPCMKDLLPEVFKKYYDLEPMIIGPGIKTGMNILYDNPREVGADRIVNAVAAYKKYGGPGIVVDLGTAISIDIIDEDGDYLGGMIAPGIAISTDALFMRASKLPRVEMIEPESAIGKTTIGGLQSGIFYGFTGMVDRMIEEILKELKRDKDQVQIIATGGFSRSIIQASKYIQRRDKLLTLDGLKYIYDQNK